MVPSENNGKMVSPDATPSNTVRTSPSTAGDGNGYGFGHPQDDHHQKDGRQALLVALEAEGGRRRYSRARRHLASFYGAWVGVTATTRRRRRIMSLNPRVVLAAIGTAAMLKQTGTGSRQKSDRGKGRSPRIMTASTAVLVAGGGLLYLWRKGQRGSEGVFDAGIQSTGGVESTLVVEETVAVVEAPESGLTSQGMSGGNGQESVFDMSGDEVERSETIADAGSTGPSKPPAGHAGGSPDVIASPEAVVDPDATPDPIVSPEPALPQRTDDGDSDK